MAVKPQPATRIRTCRACGARYEYPIKGETSTRHHCADCVALPLAVRKVTERLANRIRDLELALARLKSPNPPPATVATTTHPADQSAARARGAS